MTTKIIKSLRLQNVDR